MGAGFCRLSPRYGSGGDGVCGVGGEREADWLTDWPPPWGGARRAGRQVWGTGLATPPAGTCSAPEEESWRLPVPHPPVIPSVMINSHLRGSFVALGSFSPALLRWRSAVRKKQTQQPQNQPNYHKKSCETWCKAVELLPVMSNAVFPALCLASPSQKCHRHWPGALVGDGACGGPHGGHAPRAPRCCHNIQSVFYSLAFGRCHAKVLR